MNGIQAGPARCDVILVTGMNLLRELAK